MERSKGHGRKENVLTERLKAWVCSRSYQIVFIYTWVHSIWCDYLHTLLYLGTGHVVWVLPHPRIPGCWPCAGPVVWVFAHPLIPGYRPCGVSTCTPSYTWVLAMWCEYLHTLLYLATGHAVYPGIRHFFNSQLRLRNYLQVLHQKVTKCCSEL